MEIKFFCGLSFGYSSPLKTLFKKGKLPVKYGFYGDRLTLKNVSLEHLKPHSKGGKTTLDNLVLASKEKNNLRGDKDIKDFLNIDAMTTYLCQFMGVKRRGFDGDEYIAGILRTIEELTK